MPDHDERRAVHPGRRPAAHRRFARLPDGGPRPAAGPRPLPRPRHARRVRRARLDPVRRRERGLPPRRADRRDRAFSNPVRGRPDRGLGRHPARARGPRSAWPGRDAADGGDRGRRGGAAVRPLPPGGAPARLDHRLHGRRGDLRRAARLFAREAAVDDARGRVRLQRSRRRPARPRLHRLDPAAGLRRARHALAVREAAGDRRGRRPGSRLACRAGVQARPARHPRPLPGGLAGGRGGRVRRGRDDRGVGLPRRLPGRAGAREREHSRQADDHDLPRGPRLGGAAHDVPRLRAPDLPERRAGRGAGGHGARGRDRVRCPPAGHLRRHRLRAASRSRSGPCSAGPGCAAPCRSCSRCSR